MTSPGGPRGRRRSCRRGVGAAGGSGDLALIYRFLRRLAGGRGSAGSPARSGAGMRLAPSLLLWGRAQTAFSKPLLGPKSEIKDLEGLGAPVGLGWGNGTLGIGWEAEGQGHRSRAGSQRGETPLLCNPVPFFPAILFFLFSLWIY